MAAPPIITLTVVTVRALRYFLALCFNCKWSSAVRVVYPQPRPTNANCSVNKGRSCSQYDYNCILNVAYYLCNYLLIKLDLVQ